MAEFKHFSSSLLSILLLFSLILSSILAQHDQPPLIEEFHHDSPSLSTEIDQLKSTIQLLETRLVESTQILKTKDEKIAQLEAVTQEKDNIVASLQSEVEAAQKKDTSDVENRVGKAQARANELQKQVEKLKRKIEEHNRTREALELRMKMSDAMIEEFGSKIDKLQKINDEQKSSISKTERALKAAEAKLMKAKLEASTKSLELEEVHYAWLPPWLLNHVQSSWSFVEAEWNEHGKPVTEMLIQKTLEKKGEAEKWAEPHLETIKTKLVPAVKEQWVIVTEYVEPHVQLLTAKTAEAFESSKTAVKPHIIRVQELADPYYQDFKRASKPYIDQVATAAKPHVEKARTVLKPYTTKAVHVYGKFLESATTYHDQVRTAVHEKLDKHEVTKALATKEFVWFVASALLALPVIFLFRIFSATFFKKSMKSSHNAHKHHARRKGKRGHSDK
ncbi:hypothetical protein vseg_002683 [Gypsophila vaccaria]